MSLRSARLALTLCGSLLASCTGTVVDVPGWNGEPGSVQPGASNGGVDGPSAGSGPNAAGSTNASGPGMSTAAQPDLPFQPAPAALRKLTVRQYRNSVLELMGADAPLPTDLEADTSINGFYAIGAAKGTISPSAAEKFEAAAYALAAKGLDATHRAAFVGCAPTAAIDNKCTTDFLNRFGLRAFRRPLTAEEIARYVAVAESAQRTLGDFYRGLEFAVAGLLQSPHFLFRRELGAMPSAPSAMRAYDDYEMASRLAYLLWNSTPDAALLDAAKRGQLTTLPGLQAQAERLLSDPRARAALDDFHSERLALEELASLEKGAAVFSAVDDSLRSAMRHDVLATIAELTFGAAPDLRDLFTTRVVFVESKLASIYGLPAVTKSTRGELPASTARAGLLGKVAFLAANAHTNATSPTLRGKYIRERFLCQSIPAPPPEVATVLPAVDPNAPTMRDRLKVHASTASCAGCHKLMDPIGLSLEHFDAIGKYRETDQGHALDTSGVLDGKSFDGALALAQLLRDDPRTSDCVVRQTYRYAVAHVEGAGEEPAIKALVEQFERSGYRFTQLLRAVVVSDGFRYASAGE